MNNKDRNWIKPPNSITKKAASSVKKKSITDDQSEKTTSEIKNSPSKISYWIDSSGEAQLYSAEQLAICNVLMNLNVLLNKSLTLAEKLKTMDKDATVGTLARQDYAQFKSMQNSVYEHFIELLAAAPDITFAEFLNFISRGDESKAFSRLGKRKLKKVVENKSPDVTAFFVSDKLKE